MGPEYGYYIKAPTLTLLYSPTDLEVLLLSRNSPRYVESLILYNLPQLAVSLRVLDVS